MHPIVTDASLLNFNTFGIDCRAKNLAMVECVADVEYLASKGLLDIGGFKVIGQGSNLVFGASYDGPAVLMRNKGVRVLRENDAFVSVEVAAGEIWDEFVKNAIAQGWYGIENLVAIPGTVGGAAVQNVGAYGVEAKDVVEGVVVYDVKNRRTVFFTVDECAYGYRDSRFKHIDSGRYIITSAVFRLSKKYNPILTYKALAESLSVEKVLDAAKVADVIERIRWAKLPKPEEKGSAGSFFKNPLVSGAQFDEMKRKYPEMPSHKTDGGYKLAAGWLIDMCGWKGRILGRCGVYEKQALVLVNCGDCDGSDVRNLADAIVRDVRQQFGISLECEAEFVGV